MRVEPKPKSKLIPVIENAYVSIEIERDCLEKLRADLLEVFSGAGLECESASAKAHVSVAYGLGRVATEKLEGVAEKIAGLGFQFRVAGFEIFRGQCTPFDYLALSLESNEVFANAVEIAKNEIPLKKFDQGFRAHVSLLKFPCGELKEESACELIREICAAYGVSAALGRCPCVKGARVCVFDTNQQCRMQVPIASHAA